MKDVTGADFLGQVPLFAGMSAEDLGELSGRLRRRRYAKGEVVFLQGDPGTSLCIIESGRIKLGLGSAEGREVLLDVLGAGDFFGELALLDHEPRSADAVAIESTQVLLLDRDEFVSFLMQHSQLAIQLLAAMSRRLRRDAQLLHDAVFLDVPARLARTILGRANNLEGGNLGTPRLTQSDLAGLVGTTRETLNKWLGFYEAEGWIRWEAGRIMVLQPQKLRERIY